MMGRWVLSAKRMLVVSVVSCLVVLLFAGCGDKGGEPPQEQSYKFRTPDELLKYFAQAVKEEDIEALADALDEDFLFQCPPDFADSLGLPPGVPWWGKTEFINSIQETFENPDVTDIGFSYEYHIEWYSCAEVRDDTTFAGLGCRLDPLIEVVTITPEDPILTYLVDNSWLDVTVIPDRKTDGRWTVLRIEMNLKQL